LDLGDSISQRGQRKITELLDNKISSFYSWEAQGLKATLERVGPLYDTPGIPELAL